MADKEQVYISDYLKTRKYNHKLYSRFIELIKKRLSEQLSEREDLDIKLSMSAKYQTPQIIISEDNQVPHDIMEIQTEIWEAMDEIGFSPNGTEERDNYYIIGFED